MATEAQPAAPASQPSGQQLSTGASVEGGDINLIKVEVVPQLYTSVLFCSAPKVISNFGSDCSLERKRLCLVFPCPSIHLSNGAWVQACALQLLNRTEDVHDLG